MSRILKVSNGDYRLQVKTGGNIVLDTQSTSGTVKVIGNLDVLGTFTYIESTDTRIKDTIIQLNYGQNGAGVGNGSGPQVSGIEIDRGSLPHSQFLFDETLLHYDSTTSLNPIGTWKLTTDAGILGGIQVRSIVGDGLGDLVFDLQSGNKLLTVANTTNYYLRCINDNNIPTVKWVRNYIASNWDPNNPGNQGTSIVSTVQYPTTVLLSSANTSMQAGASTIVFQISQNTIATVSASGLTTGNVQLGGNSTPNQITTSASSGNLTLTADNKNVEINGYLNLDNQASDPTFGAAVSKIYAKSTVGPGRTGIYFNNNANQTSDELVSRNRAVLLSILL
jgi:hypothetical protein